jgi:hypothetical protein
LSDEGEYSVQVTDRIGPVTSQSAGLIPLIGPVLLQAPLPQTVAVGEPVTLGVAVSGHPLPFTFEWRRGTAPLVTNVVSAYTNFFTFNASSIATTQQFRAIIKNLANPAPGIASALVNIVTLADTDSDGIPDEWESNHGFNPTGNGDRDSDADLDGLTNFEEYIAGTNPTNNASFLQVQLTAAALPTVTFGAISNRTYTLEYRDRLNQPWSHLTDVLARPTNAIETILDSTWTTNRFYRVLTPRQP